MEKNLLCPKATALVEQLFAIFYALCSGFDSQFQDERKLKISKTHWILAFMDERIEEEKDIASALSFLRKQQKLIYVPTIGDFLSWRTQSKQSAFFSKEKAYDIAYQFMRNDLREKLSDDQLLILRHAIKASDPHFLKTNSRSATEPVFYRNYEIAVRDFLSGELKPIPKAIESDAEREDKWKTLKKYGVLPEYAHLTSRDLAMPVIKEHLERNGGLTRMLPYDKHRRS